MYQETDYHYNDTTESDRRAAEESRDAEREIEAIAQEARDAAERDADDRAFMAARLPAPFAAAMQYARIGNGLFVRVGARKGGR